nr:hypothetical protein [Bacilli bacterium]
MKKIMLYMLTIFVMFIGINNVDALFVGKCNYIKDGDDKTAEVNVYSNNTANISFGLSSYSIESGTKFQRIYNKAECYEYAFIDTAGINHYTLTDDGSDNDANNPYGGSRYTLVNKKNMSCKYQITVDGYSGYLYINQKPNSSYPLVGFGPDKSESSRTWLSPSGSSTLTLKSGANTKNYSFTPDYLYETSVYDEQTPNQGYGLEGAMTINCPNLFYASKGNEIAITYQRAMLQYIGAEESTIKNLIANNFDLPTAGPNDQHCSINLTFKDDSKTGTLKIDRENGVKATLTIDSKSASTTYDASVTNNSYAGTGNQIILDAGTGDIAFKLGRNMLAKINAGNYTCNGLKKDIVVYSDADLNYETIYRSYYLITDDTKDLGDFKWVSSNSNVSDDEYVNTVVNNVKEREKDYEGTDVSNDCKGLLGPNTLAFLKQAMNVIMIVGPIIAVVLGTYELITAMAAGDDDAKKKGLKKFQNRLIA